MENALRDVLVDFRKSRGITKKEMADKLTIGVRAYCDFESGIRTPRMSVLAKIANISGITEDQLLGRATIIPAVPSDVKNKPDFAKAAWTIIKTIAELSWIAKLADLIARTLSKYQP